MCRDTLGPAAGRHIFGGGLKAGADQEPPLKSLSHPGERKLEQLAKNCNTDLSAVILPFLLVYVKETK